MTPFDWGDRLPTLIGSRTVLRPVEESDVPDLFAVFSDEQAMGGWNQMQSEADAADFVRRSNLGFERRSLFRWGIADSADNRIVGSCGLFFIDPAHQRGEIGFMLRPGRWGQGLAADAVSTLVAFAFERVGLHRIEAFCVPENDRAIRLLERLGFQQEGQLRERYQVGGKAVNALAFGLLKPESRVRR